MKLYGRPPLPQTYTYYLQRLMSYTALLSITFTIPMFNVFLCWLFTTQNFRPPWGEWVGIMPYEQHPSC